MKADESLDEYQSKIAKKCPYCFRKDACMLLPSQRALYCLGPFKDDDDWMAKIRADHEAEEEADRKTRERGLKKFHGDRALELFNHNKLLTKIAMEGINDKEE